MSRKSNEIAIELTSEQRRELLPIFRSMKTRNTVMAQVYCEGMVVTKLSQRETVRVREALRASQSRGKKNFYERRREIEG